MANAVSKKLTFKRRIIQLYAALLYNAQLKGFVNGKIYTGKTKNFCVPGLNCYSCPGAIGACPLGALQNALASSTTRLPVYMLGILGLLGLSLGRTICGFLCPFGLIQELLHKIPSPKLKKSKATRVLSYLKYVILAVFVIAIPLYNATKHLPLPAFCKYICPAGTLEGAIGLLSNPANTGRLSMLGVLFTRKFVIMVLILAAAVFIYRVFCRFICPLGAIYGLFSKIALVGVRVDESKCTGCGLCVKTCKMDVKCVGDHECINCGECIAKCPAKAISMKAFGHSFETAETENKKASKIKKILPYVIAAAVLALAIWYTNKPESSGTPAVTAGPDISGGAVTSAPEMTDAAATQTPAATPTPALETGKEVGMLLPDFSVPVYGGDTFNTADYRGKVLIINFWATWCNPCVNELKYFEQIAAEYPDTVQVIAIHSSLVTEDVDKWIAREDYALTFALDDNKVIESLGGSTILPMTVVVSPDGIITYNKEGSVTYEKLLNLIDEAIKR